MSVVEYKELVVEDTEKLQQLRLAVIASDPRSFSLSMDEEKNTPIGVIKGFIENCSSSENAMILGAWASDLIGVIGVERYHGEIKKHKARIWGPYVELTNRQKGVGEKLLLQALEFARSVKDLEMVNLETSTASESAKRLFKKVGFHETGRELKALCFNGEYFDLISMQYELSA